MERLSSQVILSSITISAKNIWLKNQVILESLRTPPGNELVTGHAQLILLLVLEDYWSYLTEGSQN